MANTQVIKRRIKSVSNTKQITKAMELVAASKLRRAQESALRTRPYFNAAREILSRLSELTDAGSHPLFKAKKNVKNRLYVVITSDRGLAGAYNSNILKMFANQAEINLAQKIATNVIVIGRTGAKFINRIDNVEIIGAYDSLPVSVTQSDIEPIATSIKDQFLTKKSDEIYVLFTKYESSVSQVALSRRLLPIDIDKEVVSIKGDIQNALVEPDPRSVLNKIVPKLVVVEFLQSVLEASASEHSMRMMAMKSASDNASDLIDDLTLVYNGARQAAITQELAEITGGAAAIT